MTWCSIVANYREIPHLPSERISTTFTRLAENLSWCIANEDVLLFSAENPVTVASIRVRFAGIDGDDVGAYFSRMVLSAAKGTHLSGASHRFVVHLATTVESYVATITAIDVFVASIAVGGLATLFWPLFSPPFPLRLPRPPLPRPPQLLAPHGLLRLPVFVELSASSAIKA